MARIDAAEVPSVSSAPAAVAATPAIANPGPLGLCGFALTTFVLSSANAGLFTGATVVVGLALFYGGLAQLLAGMWEFKTGNTFGATAFTSYGAFWLSVAAILELNLVPKEHPEAMAFFLLGWTIFTGLMWIATLKTNVGLILLFGLLFVTFILLTMGDFGAPTKVLGGYLGLATAIVAWYNALAGLLSAGPSGIKLPVGPL